MPTDDEMYRRYLAGDRDAGDQLMLRGGDRLIAYLNAFVHSPEDAEDLMLDAYTVILVKKPRIREGCFQAYLYKTARRMAWRLNRRNSRLMTFALDENTLPAEEQAEKSLLTAERDEMLNRGLNRIAPQYREALYLVYETGLSYQKAADIMGCGRKRIENLLTNGKAALRRELEKEGITHADI